MLWLSYEIYNRTAHITSAVNTKLKSTQIWKGNLVKMFFK